MHKMSVKLSVAALAMSGALAAFSAGFDGMSLATNDWFDANFTALTADTAITADSTTGITLGAGSWTAVPSTGTATVVADTDAGGGATMLSLDAPGEELVFAPAAFSLPTGYETVSFVVKGDASDTHPSMVGDVQAAFTLVDDGTTVTATGYTADGWTNLVYSAGADTLTNAWFTMYMDFANVGGVRYVRFSVKPSGASAPTILADAESTAWFRTATSATAINTVSLSGVGSCRTFNGDSLEAIPVATWNDTEYTTVNEAIAAANAGDTVTLIRDLSGIGIEVNKSITLDLGGHSLSADVIDIDYAATLTIGGTIAVGSITGGGALAANSNANLQLEGGSYALNAIDIDGNLTISGNGTMSVSGDVSVSGALTFTPDAYATTVAEAHGAYTIKLSAATIAAGVLSGGAFLETADGVTVGGTSSFYGTIAGAGGVAATGSTLTLSGAATFTGTLEVKSGTVAIDSSLTGISHSFRLDASVADSILENADGYVTNWVSQSGVLPAANACFTNETSVMTVTTDYFGGKSAVRTANSQLYNNYLDGDGKSKFASHLVGAVRLISQTGSSGAMIWNTGAKNRYIGRRSSTSAYAYWTKMEGSSTEDMKGIWQGGVYADRSYTYSETILDFLDFDRSNTSKFGAVGGAEADIAIGELIGFDGNQSKPNIETLHRIETYLANKWSIPGVAKSLAATVPVTLTSGAVLDLGGLSLTVASLSGSGTVQNGTLTVTDPISVAVGQTLVIPYGSTYTCASGTGANIDTTAGTVTFVHKAADIDGVAYETVQDAIEAYESGTLTIYENATDIDLGTTEVSISGIVLADGVSAPTFSTTLPWQTTYSEGSLTHTRVVSTFVYVGPAAYAVDASNFEIGGVVASDVPGTGDTVQFDTATAITLSSAQEYRYAEIIANAAVTVSVSANKNAYIYADAISGTGKFSLGNYVILSTASAASTISCELEVNAENASVAAQLYVASETRTFTLTGALSGSGYLKCTRTRNGSGYTGCTFHCSDTTRFSGTIEMVRPNDGVGRNIITFWPTCDLSGATVVVGEYSSSYGRFIDGQSNNTVYKFGSLSGYVSPSASSVADNTHPTIEIGALNKNDTIAGNWMPHSSRNPYIRKIGTGTLTTTAANAYGYILNGGTLKVLATDTATVTTEVSGMKPVCTTKTIDAVEYRVYTLSKKAGSMVLIF